jgi:hypothetical protein
MIAKASGRRRTFTKARWPGIPAPFIDVDYLDTGTALGGIRGSGLCAYRQQQLMTGVSPIKASDTTNDFVAL